MTTLVVLPETDARATPSVDTTDAALISDHLASIGVEFGRWSVAAGTALGADPSPDEVLAAYAADVDRLRSAGYVTVDVARLRIDPSDPAQVDQAAGARQKFLAEHRHAEDEVRFFVEGSGAFYLRLDGRVHIVVCTAGDFISVPAGTRHWFDMGTAPHFAALRFFQTADGWVGDFTGDDIATRFPTFDELVAAQPR